MGCRPGVCGLTSLRRCLCVLVLLTRTHAPACTRVSKVQLCITCLRATVPSRVRPSECSYEQFTSSHDTGRVPYICIFARCCVQVTYGVVSATHGSTLGGDGDAYTFGPGEFITSLRIHTQRRGSATDLTGISFITTYSGGEYRGLGDTSGTANDATPCPDSLNNPIRLNHFAGYDSQGFFGGVIALTAVWTTYTRPPSPPPSPPPPSPVPPSPPAPPPSPPPACASLRIGPFGTTEMVYDGSWWDDEGTYRAGGRVTR